MYIDLSQCFSPTIPSELCPLILFVILAAIIFCPFPILYYSSRRWFVISLGRIVLSLFFSVEFRDFFIADELNSLAYTFWTSSYFFCSYAWHWDQLATHCTIWRYLYTPIIASLPPWWRLLQCVRRYIDSKESVHVYNGLKYTTSILATLITGYRRIYGNIIKTKVKSVLFFFFLSKAVDIAWILSCILNSIYTSYWDVRKDWGLFEPHCRNFLLRKNIVFYKWSYYLAMPVNVLLRFSWVLNFSPDIRRELLWLIIAVLEAYRRLQWNFFRMENEHLNNCGNYHAIKEIPLPFPLNSRPSSNMDDESIRSRPTPTEIIEPQPIHSKTTDTSNFYGRRDFENRRNVEKLKSTMSNRPSSVLDLFNRLKKSSSDESDLDPDDEFSE
ncbi:EXS-domain-containing protein [Backusella circina FSU 941]|nr:EXS-domain-containing protein [Backusella circina FSU 941]